MAQIPNGRLIKGQYTPICRDCAMYYFKANPPKKRHTEMGRFFFSDRKIPWDSWDSTKKAGSV